MRIGIIGTGRIASAIVGGLDGAGNPPTAVIVSPRNAGTASALAARYPRVAVAADNQAVLDASDCVVLSLRPPTAREALSPLRFRPDHHVISVMALVPLATLAPLVAPAGVLARALTLPSVAARTGPILHCPGDAATGGVLSGLGTPIAVDDERQLEVLWAVTALIAPFYALVEQSGKWAAGHGVDSTVAMRYAAGFYRALAGPLDAADAIEPLIAEAQTPGGLNEQALRTLRQAGWLEAVDPVLDAVLARLADA